MICRRSAQVLIVLVLGAFSSASADTTPDQRCDASRAKAAAAYVNCQQKEISSYYRTTIGAVPTIYVYRASRCRMNYAARWAAFQTNPGLAGSACATARLVDNGDGTVTDKLTGLQWEKKTTDASIHDVGNAYTWSISGTAADGTAFTTFLSTLNAAPCFAGQCDWRMPTRAELETLLVDAYTGAQCATPSCIDPIFGPTWAGEYWSSTSNLALPDNAWYVTFFNGHENIYCKLGEMGDWYSIRAVRGGL